MNRTAPSIEDDSIARGNPTIDLDMASLDVESSIINDSVWLCGCVFLNLSSVLMPHFAITFFHRRMCHLLLSRYFYFSFAFFSFAMKPHKSRKRNKHEQTDKSHVIYHVAERSFRVFAYVFFQTIPFGKSNITFSYCGVASVKWRHKLAYKSIV